MSEFAIDLSIAEREAGALEDMYIPIIARARQISSILERIDESNESFAKVAAALRRQAIEVNTLSKEFRLIGAVLAKSVQQYRETESRISGTPIPVAQLQEMGEVSLVPSPSNRALSVDNSSDTEANTEYSYILKQISNLAKQINEIIEDNGGDSSAGISAGAAVLSWISIWQGLYEPGSDHSTQGLIQWVLDFMKGGTGALKGLATLLKDTGASAIYGVIGAGTGIIGELIRLSGRSIPEQLHSSGGLFSDIGKLATEIDKYVNRKFYTTLSKAEKNKIKAEKKGIAVAYCAVATMLTDAVATIYDKVQDGQFNWNDLSSTLLHVGSSGLSSVTGSYIPGVSIDADRSTDIYTMSANYVAGVINQTGAPTAVKVALSIPGTVVAAAEGTVLTFLDFGMQIGGKIRSIFG